MIESATMAGIVCVDDLDAPHISRYGLYCDPTNGTFPLVKDRPSRKEAMRSITIPDHLYVEVQRAAEASGVSVDYFVSEALQLHLGDEHYELDAPKLTPSQVAGGRKARASIAAGKGLTMAQVEQNLAARKAAWLQANPR